MALVKKGKDLWFFEDLYSDTTYGFKVSRVIVPETDTGFQKLMILETDRFGRVLVLDGIVQLTEEDEGIYHEWIAHWPLFALKKPAQHVLIIGGGDCGVAREALRHKSVEKVTMVEIDRMVCDLCRRHMPSVSEGVYDDPRFKLIIGDGAEVIRQMKGKCDVIVIDSTDPIGPARSLFNTDFYRSVYDALTDGGITIHQTGALILQPFEAPGSWRQIERSFDDVRVVQFANISYMGGPFSLTAGSKGRGVFKNAERNALKAYKKAGFRTSWYSPGISAVPYPEFQKRLETDKYGEEIVMDIDLPAGGFPDARRVANWAAQTCEAIKMKAFGKPIYSDPRLGEGATLVQYVETSAINYRRYGRVAALNCFTCAALPVDDAIRSSLDYFKSGKAVCWHLPRGSFADVRKIRKNTRIYEYDRRSGKASPALLPRLIDCADAFAPEFPFFRERSAAEFELVMDIYDCDYDRISSSPAVARWAGIEFPKLTGLKTVGKADAPDFGHAKKKTAGPSVVQLLRGGSNISHYSVNWLMIVVNIVVRQEFDLEKAIRRTMKYFRGKYAVCWLLPRGNTGEPLKKVAENTYIFMVEEK
ncbi:MAG: polyamine aminopropyltransferase [Acidobacteria bacterium]|jgi:spermidine synthase|nr:polyamine aminopropyltransferase [Acidobacteriota bacterium]